MAGRPRWSPMTRSPDAHSPSAPPLGDDRAAGPASMPPARSPTRRRQMPAKCRRRRARPGRPVRTAPRVSSPCPHPARSDTGRPSGAGAGCADPEIVVVRSRSWNRTATGALGQRPRARPPASMCPWRRRARRGEPCRSFRRRRARPQRKGATHRDGASEETPLTQVGLGRQGASRAELARLRIHAESEHLGRASRVRPNPPAPRFRPGRGSCRNPGHSSPGAYRVRCCHVVPSQAKT